MIGKIALWIGALVLYVVILIPMVFIGVFWAYWIWCIAALPALLVTIDGVRLDSLERLVGAAWLGFALFPLLLYFTRSNSPPEFLVFLLGVPVLIWPVVVAIVGIRCA